MDEAAPLEPVFEHPGRFPAGYGRGEQRGDTRVRGLPGEARPIDVVVPQRDRRPAGGPRPRRGEVLLGKLAEGVHAPRVGRSVLGGEGRDEDGAVVRVPRVEEASRKIGLAARRRPDCAARDRMDVRALAVDHHGGGEDESAHSVAGERGDEFRRREHVGCGVRRRVLHTAFEAHLGREMAHDVHSREHGVERPRVARVAADVVGAVVLGWGRPLLCGVCGVEDADVPPVVASRPNHGRTDESSAPGDEQPHPSSRASAPSRT